LGYLASPPSDPQIAAANDYLSVILEAVKLAQATMISHNLRLQGTAQDQESFALAWSYIRGKASIALATGTTEAAAKAKAETNALVDELILNEPKFAKYRVGVAVTDDPLMR